MKNLLITQASLGGFVGLQAVAECLVLKQERVAGWVCGPGALSQTEQALTPVDRAPAPHKEPQASGPGLGWLPGVHQLQNGEWTPGKSGLRHQNCPAFSASTNKLTLSITFLFLSLNFPPCQRAK